MAPGQQRFVCKPASEKQKQEYRSCGFANAAFSAKQPLGKNTIRELLKEAAKRVGIERWKDFRPHELRSAFISRLANDCGVSMTETMASGESSIFFMLVLVCCCGLCISHFFRARWMPVCETVALRIVGLPLCLEKRIRNCFIGPITGDNLLWHVVCYD